MTFEPTTSTEVDDQPDRDQDSGLPASAEGAVAAPPAHGRAPRKSSGVRNAIEWLAIIAAALAVAFVIKTYLVQAFYIPSGSMEQTLKIGDRVLVNKLSYDLHDVHRGDIVVFSRPPNEGGSPEIKDLIKRVVGLPNDTIETQDGRIFINGKPLSEPYLHGVTTVPAVTKQVIPPGHIFVMGDNRGNSRDSRVFGPISTHLVVGRAFVRVWPLSALNLL